MVEVYLLVKFVDGTVTFHSREHPIQHVLGKRKEEKSYLNGISQYRDSSRDAKHGHWWYGTTL